MWKTLLNLRNTDFSDIPTEVLPYIFKYLPLEDRKNVRLTCSLWKDSCNRAEIVAKEKFVFRQGTCGDSVPALGNCILKCKTFRTHVEFHGLQIWQLPSAVWQYFGDRIQSLILHNCSLGDEVGGNIIVHCSNLISLTVHSSRSQKYSSDVAGWDFCSEYDLDDLIARKFEHRKLVTLELCIEFFQSIGVCRKLFRVFPRLKTFSQGDWSFYVTCDDEIEWDKPEDKCTPPTNLMDVRTEFSKWSKLRFKGFAKDFEVVPSDPIFEFLSEQSELERVHLQVWSTTSSDYNLRKDLLFHVLNKLPKLKDLEFNSHLDHFDFTPDEFGDFLVKTSQLESLRLSFRSECNWVQVSSPSTKYTNLKKLDMKYFASEQVTQEILDRCCKSLTHLYVSVMNHKIMRRIFDFHTDLKTLHINISFLSRASELGCSSTSNHGAKYSFKQLRSKIMPPQINIRQGGDRAKNAKCLQHLEIWGLPLDYVLSSTPIIEFDFPNLTYLRVEITRKAVPKKDLQSLLDIVSLKAPRLEVLKYSHNSLNAIELTSICKRLKNLRFLIIDHYKWLENLRRRRYLPGRKHDKNLEKLFIQCPSLYAVTSFHDQTAYVYDHFSKKLKFYNDFTAFPYYEKP